MIVSIANWYKVLNQVLELTTTHPGIYYWKKYMYCYKYFTMVEIWSTKQYNTLYRNLHEFPALGKKFICTAQEILVVYNSCHPMSFCIAKRLLQKFLLISLSVHNDTVVVPKICKFPVLVWQILPFHCYFWVNNLSIQVNPILTRSGPES